MNFLILNIHAGLKEVVLLVLNSVISVVHVNSNLNLRNDTKVHCENINLWTEKPRQQFGVKKIITQPKKVFKLQLL